MGQAMVARYDEPAQNSDYAAEAPKPALRKGASLGPTVAYNRQSSNASGPGLDDLLEDSVRLPKTGADLGNGFVVNYRQLLSLKRLQRDGVPPEEIPPELLQQPYLDEERRWTLGQQIKAQASKRRRATAERKNARYFTTRAQRLPSLKDNQLLKQNSSERQQPEYIPSLNLKGQNLQAYFDKKETANYHTASAAGQQPYFEQISQIESGAFEASELAASIPWQSQDLFPQQNRDLLDAGSSMV